MQEEISASVIAKYKGKTTAQIKAAAITVFNAWIRKRDSGLPCISCGSPQFHHAGHFYSAGHHNGLRFHEDNCHGQCVRCNWHLRGNLINYRNGLLRRVGHERLAALDMLALSKKAHKDDRITLIMILEKYKSLLK